MYLTCSDHLRSWTAISAIVSFECRTVPKTDLTMILSCRLKPVSVRCLPCLWHAESSTCLSYVCFAYVYRRPLLFDDTTCDLAQIEGNLLCHLKAAVHMQMTDALGEFPSHMQMGNQGWAAMSGSSRGIDMHREAKDDAPPPDRLRLQPRQVCPYSIRRNIGLWTV